jgi:hypothetical protein
MIFRKSVKYTQIWSSLEFKFLKRPLKPYIRQRDSEIAAGAGENKEIGK